MKLHEIHIRDPFILLNDNKYYLYGTRGSEACGKGTGLDVFISDDLDEWSNSIEIFSKPEDFWADEDFWAPEVHKYKDKFYMFVSFKSKNRCRGTQILVSNHPAEPFKVHSPGPVTPINWECLDGTFFLAEDNTPYMVFCHEWVQVCDGEMLAVELSKDLRQAVGEPFLLFKASDPVWAEKDADSYVTDGPFMYRLNSGGLLMIWSSFSDNKYLEAISYSDNGKIDGKWYHKKDLLFSENGGHGMIFKTKNGDLMYVMHTPNISPNERPVLKRIREKDDTLCFA